MQWAGSFESHLSVSSSNTALFQKQHMNNKFWPVNRFFLIFTILLTTGSCYLIVILRIWQKQNMIQYFEIRNILLVGFKEAFNGRKLQNIGYWTTHSKFWTTKKIYVELHKISNAHLCCSCRWMAEIQNSLSAWTVGAHLTSPVVSCSPAAPSAGSLLSIHL